MREYPTRKAQRKKKNFNAALLEIRANTQNTPNDIAVCPEGKLSQEKISTPGTW